MIPVVVTKISMFLHSFLVFIMWFRFHNSFKTLILNSLSLRNYILNLVCFWCAICEIASSIFNNAPLKFISQLPDHFLSDTGRSFHLVFGKAICSFIYKSPLLSLITYEINIYSVNVIIILTHTEQKEKEDENPNGKGQEVRSIPILHAGRELFDFLTNFYTSHL